MKKMELGIACILAIGALCFTSIAFALSPDKVRSKHIKEADGTSGQDTNIGSGVKTGHIQDNAISDVKISDVSMDKVTGLADALANIPAGPDGPMGPVGPQGPQGPIGSAGPMGKEAVYGNVTVVATSGGVYEDPSVAMSDITNWCGTPTTINTCLVKIMPGTYEITTPMQMKSFVDVEGSGENVTKISSSGLSVTVTAINTQNAEIRALTLDSTIVGEGDVWGGSLSVSGNSDISIRDVDVISVNPSVGKGGSQAVLQNSGKLAMKNVNIYSSAFASHAFKGKMNDAQLTMIDSTITVDVPTINQDTYGMWLVWYNGSPTIELDNVKITAVDPSVQHSIGIYSQVNTTAYPDSRIVLDIKNSEISTSTYGIYAHGTDLTVRNTSIIASGGIYSNYKSIIDIANSDIISGNSSWDDAALYLRNNTQAKIANTKLSGQIKIPGMISLGGSLKCFNAYDENLDLAVCP